MTETFKEHSPTADPCPQSGNDRHYRSFIDNNPHGIFSVNAAGRFTSANPACERICGYTVQELLALDFQRLCVPDQVEQVLAWFQQGLGGASQMREITMIHKMGHHVRLRVTRVPISTDGQITGLYCMAEDITVHQKAQDALRAREEQLRNLGDNIPTGAIYQYVSRPDGSIYYAYMSAGIERMTGMTAEQVLADPEAFHALIVAEDRERLALAKAESIRDLLPFDCEFRQRTVTGQVRWVHCRSTPRRLEDGSTIWDGVVTDITERKQADDTLRESESRFRSYFNLGLIGAAITSPTKGWLEVNEEVCRILGYERHELISKTWAELTLPDDLGADVAQFQRVIAGEMDAYSLDKRWIRKDGRVVDSTISVQALRRADGEVDYFIALIQDITARKAAERALAESEQRYRGIVETAEEGIATHEPDGTITYVNQRMADMLGYPREAIIGKSSLDFVDEEEKAAVIRARNMVKEQGKFSAERRLHRKDGTTLWTLTNVTPRRDGVGNFIGYLAMHTDFTQRKRMEENLDSMRMLLAEGQKLAHLGSFEYIVETHETFWSDEEFRIYGLEPGPHSPSFDDLMQKHFHPDDAARVSQVFGAALNSGSIYETEHRILRPDGSVRNLYNIARPFFDTAGKLIKYTGATLDITERKRAEEALRHSEARYRRLLQSIPVPLGVVVKSGHIIHFNDRFTQVFGYNQEDIPTLEDWWRRAYPDPAYRREVVENWKAKVRRSAETGTETEQEERNVTCKDGTVRVVMISNLVIEDNILATFIDITARKRAEEQLRTNALRLAAVLDAQRTIAGANLDYTGLLELILVSITRLIGADGASLEIGDGDEMVYEASTGLAAGFVGLRLKIAGSLSGLCMTSGELQRADDTETDPRVDRAACRRVGLRSMIVMPLRYDEHSFGVLKLMSARVAAFDTEAEQTLRFMGEFLGVTVARKKAAEALHQANEQLRETDRRKDEFLAMLAHELRNPLAPVRNAVQVLRLTGSKEPAAVRQKDIIDRQVTHMARLLDDLLDVSRVTRGKIVLDRKSLPMMEVLAHAVETVTPLIQSRRHELFYTPPAEQLLVDGDIDRLAQVFGNLLANAAKYTNEGGRIWLEAAREDGQAVVRVRDTGIGIAPEMLPRVFDLFAQADHSLGHAQGGLGIGLTMVQKLVQMHGGSVEARSAGLDQGSEFIVRLPALPMEPINGNLDVALSATDNVASAVSLRVLVADDIVDSAESLAELISLWGHEAKAAFSGQSALQLARAFKPDLVLLDIGMPEMDGYEVARRLREEHGQGMILVAMTGYGQQQDRQATRAAGFNHHLVKPVDLGALGKLLLNPGR